MHQDHWWPGRPPHVWIPASEVRLQRREGEWYALVHNLGMDMNMRITQPVPGVPNKVTYTTGFGLTVPDADDAMHTFKIVVNDPHRFETECPNGAQRPYLADGVEASVGEVRLFESDAARKNSNWACHFYPLSVSRSGPTVSGTYVIGVSSNSRNASLQ